MKSATLVSKVELKKKERRGERSLEKDASLVGLVRCGRDFYLFFQLEREDKKSLFVDFKEGSLKKLNAWY